MSTKELNRAYVEVVVAQARHHVGPAGSRSDVQRWIECWHLRHGLNVGGEDLTDAVLDHFDSDPDPRPYVDYLPESPAAEVRRAVREWAAQQGLPTGSGDVVPAATLAAYWASVEVSS